MTEILFTHHISMDLLFFFVMKKRNVVYLFVQVFG